MLFCIIEKNFDRPSDLVRLNQFVEPYLKVIGDKDFPFASCQTKHSQKQ
jgi:hypothetical protein